MRVHYNPDASVLHFDTGTPGVVGHTLYDDGHTVIGSAPEGGHEIAYVTIIGASAFLPLGKRGYDAETDTLQLGNAMNEHDKGTENGDITVRWRRDKELNSDYLCPMGVEIRNASVHIANMKILSQEAAAH